MHQEAPDVAAGRPGLIEIADRTLILGLYDDVAIRVAGTEQHARLDVRSASRYGGHDLGRNADRVRVILKEVVTVMESTVPAARGGEDAEEEEGRQRGTATQSTFEESSQAISPRSAKWSMCARSDSVAAPTTALSRSR